MPANGFMNAMAVAHCLNPGMVTAVYFALTAQLPAHQFRKTVGPVVLINSLQPFHFYPLTANKRFHNRNKKAPQARGFFSSYFSDFDLLPSKKISCLIHQVFGIEIAEEMIRPINHDQIHLTGLLFFLHLRDQRL